MSPTSWFHVAAVHPMVVHDALSVVQQYAPARVGAISARVLEQLAEPGRFAGLLVHLPAAEALEESLLFTKGTSVPTLALLDTVDRAALNKLARLGMQGAALPVELGVIHSFVRRALFSSFFPSDCISRSIARYATARNLTPREVQLLAYTVGGEPRPRMLARLGISENTLKTQVRGLLRKCGERNLDSLASRVLRGAFALPTDAPEEENEQAAARPELRVMAGSS